VLPDDLLRGVSLTCSAPGSRSPPGFAIEHEDGAVCTLSIIQAQPLLGLAEVPLPAALGQIARDLGVADQLSIAVVDAADDDVRQKREPSLRTAAFVLDAAFLARGGQASRLRPPRPPL